MRNHRKGKQVTMGAHAIRVALVTNIPAPYRLPVYDSLATDPQIQLKVYFCSGREPDRKWDLRESSFEQHHLFERYISYNGRFIHINPDVWGGLRLFRPEVVITTGFNPTHLIAYLYSRVHGARHIAMTDGTFESEKKLSGLHRWLRRRVYAGSQAFIGASDGAFELYKSYSIDAKRIFKSHLCANNTAFFNTSPVEKRFDFIFCGRFVAIKNPLFAIEVACQVAKRLGRRVSIVFVGSGEMEAEMHAAADAAADDVVAVFAGFARQEMLPQLYGSARIFLFPTQWDPWGVVANEACAAGLPVLIAPVAGSARELVRDGKNGYVLPLVLQQWTDAAARLLSDGNLYKSMSARSRELVQEYSYENAAAGIVNAVRMSLGHEGQHPLSTVERPRVVIIQRRLTHYRVPLFELMSDLLAKRGIDLIVAYGDPTPAEQVKADSGSLAGGVHLPTRYFLNGRLCWQNAWGVIQGADLVVVTQENKLLFNHLLMSGKQRFQLAFWGHGRNFQATGSNALSEILKRWIAKRADWWFAYTETSAAVVREAGFDASKITVLNNAVDTAEMAAMRQNVTPAKLDRLQSELCVQGDSVGIFVGSLYSEKRVEFMLDAASAIHARLPEFEFLVVGSGPQQALVENFCLQNTWAKYLGVRKGQDKVDAMALAKVMINPGLVGLGILDSFVCGVPMLTTDCGLHSPEIVYLENGANGLMTANTADAYVSAVVALLADDEALARLQQGCQASATTYTVENMARNFADGVMRCLAAPIYRGQKC